MERRFWVTYWLMAICFAVGSVLMRFWEDGGTQNWAWWIGVHAAGCIACAVVLFFLLRGPLKDMLQSKDEA